MGAGINLLQARYGGSFTYAPRAPNGSLILRFCGAGAAEVTVRGKKVTNTRGTVLVAPWGDINRTTVLPDARANLPAASTFIGISPEIVNDCLRDMFPDLMLKQFEFMPLLDLDTRHGQMLASLCRGVAQGMIGERLLARSEKAALLLSEAIVRFLFEEVDHRAGDYGRQRSPGVVPRHVKRAIDFMHANMHLPITLTDISRAAGASTRALQMGFKQFRDTTPLAYLRQIRLQAVHSELSNNENTLTIQEVALKWGFSHMGRFSAQYRETFGVSPSITAKRGSHK
ncbi:helix-turn-helix transcriptional regulator [Roseibium salinum]|uniref:Helix-turn-helix transcriptional regulator n=1 Tax=Roseibium salinum TaxID=1604349 RepID=A0ABT3QW07_9HYPH|nr:helix-turn-helix transcriptional regulator [Roseibium sp. DSM 29163]MCX2721114.1 helix-turn-helix transcriptional regulator [Roseibium sp. DSM 29163]